MLSSGSLPSPTNSTLDPPYSPTKSEMEENSDTADFNLGASPEMYSSPGRDQQDGKFDDIGIDWEEDDPIFLADGILDQQKENIGGEENVGEAVEMTDKDSVELELVWSKEDLTEINEEELDDDIATFLKNTENKNTKASTEAIVTKYNRVMSLVAKKTKKDFVPLDATPREEIPLLLARFFRLVRTKKNEIYNASSYNTFLSCFGRYLADAFKPPIDMKNDISFKIVRKTVTIMKKKAQATKGKKPGVKAARAIAPRHIQQAWACGAIGRDNPDALNAAGYLAFTTGLGCRAVEEVTKVPNRAVIFGPNDDKHGLPEWIELDEEWVCKNRQGNDPRKLEARITPDHENPGTCMVRTIMEIQRRKQEKQKVPEKRFWWNVYDPARADPEKYEKWFKNCVMGKHTIAKLLFNALQKSGVDCKAEKYTATSARKTMLDGGLDAGIPEVLLGRKAGHRTDKSKNSYIKNKDVTHRATNITLSRVGAGLNANYQEILNKILKEDEQTLAKKVSKRGEAKEKESYIHQDHYLYDDDEDETGHTISQSRIAETHNKGSEEARGHYQLESGAGGSGVGPYQVHGGDRQASNRNYHEQITRSINQENHYGAGQFSQNQLPLGHSLVGAGGLHHLAPYQLPTYGHNLYGQNQMISPGQYFQHGYSQGRLMQHQQSTFSHLQVQVGLNLLIFTE